MRCGQCIPGYGVYYWFGRLICIAAAQQSETREFNEKYGEKIGWHMRMDHPRMRIVFHRPAVDDDPAVDEESCPDKAQKPSPQTMEPGPQTKDDTPKTKDDAPDRPVVIAELVSPQSRAGSADGSIQAFKMMPATKDNSNPDAPQTILESNETNETNQPIDMPEIMSSI